MKFVIKLFPEISIKSKPVRRTLTRRLASNIKRVLKPLDVPFHIEREWDRLHLLLGADAQADAATIIIDQLRRVPGIANFSLVQDAPFTDLASIADGLPAAFYQQAAQRSFAVRVRRVGEHGFSSVDVERRVGAEVLRRAPGARVDLQQPDVTLRLELRDHTLLWAQERIEGLGGYPLGSQEAVLSLVSGGFDSSVASYLTMRRGLLTHFCFFNLGGSAHESGVKQVAHYLWQRYGSSHRVRFISVPFEPVVQALLTDVDAAQMGVLLKRLMLQAATRIARDMDIAALVTGESVAQVSSQTLTNLAVIDQATDMLTLRPLAMMDKPDIIHQARAIGVAEFAENMPEYCAVISDRPTTRARLHRVEQQTQRLPDTLVADAVANAKIETIDSLGYASAGMGWEAAVTEPETDAVIVDVRHPEEQLKTPLAWSHNAVLNIPFYELQTRFGELEPERDYLLYCPRGVMSRLHAQALRAQGYVNVQVFEPGTS